jgi:hypothetical protein
MKNEKGIDDYVDRIHEKLVKQYPKLTKSMIRNTIRFYVANILTTIKAKRKIRIDKYIRMKYFTFYDTLKNK